MSAIVQFTTVEDFVTAIEASDYLPAYIHIDSAVITESIGHGLSSQTWIACARCVVEQACIWSLTVAVGKLHAMDIGSTRTQKQLLLETRAEAFKRVLNEQLSERVSEMTTLAPGLMFLPGVAFPLLGTLDVEAADEEALV